MLTSTSYPRSESDWQGIFIRRMTDALTTFSEIKLSIWAPDGPRNPRLTEVTSPGDKRWLADIAAQGGVAHLLRNGKLWSRVQIICQLLVRLRRAYLSDKEIDIVHINWLQNVLALLGMNRRVLVTVLGTDYKLLAVPLVSVFLRLVMRTNRVLIAPNAEWMVPKLEAEFGKVADIVSIPFGIGTQWFEIERLNGGMDENWLVVLRVTPEKIGPLFEWGGSIFNSTRKLHLFGPMQHDVYIPSWVHYHGSTTPEELAGKWFPNACGLISLSQHDEGRPQVMLEAMAAGLPIIASSIEAHTDLIRHGETGLLVDSVDQFEEAISFLTCPQNNELISINARKFTAKHFGTWEDCAQRYIAAYRRLLN